MKEENYCIQKPSIDRKNIGFISSLPYVWLFSSILFLLIATIVAPLFWPQLDRVDAKTQITTLNITLGISGILVYVLEPFIWHNKILRSAKEKSGLTKTNADKNESWLSMIAKLVISLALGLLITLPYLFTLFFKPVLRAMILYVSLSFLNIGHGNLGEHPLFVIPVIADILLYYLNMMAPDWKFNPINVITGAINLKNRNAVQYFGSLFLIIHTALIYALLLAIAYYDFNRHPEILNLKTLSWWWLILTVYTRMSFVTDDFDIVEFFESMSRKDRLLNILALSISFISFIWPFYFAS
jgi:hypothetical protein